MVENKRFWKLFVSIFLLTIVIEVILLSHSKSSDNSTASPVKISPIIDPQSVQLSSDQEILFMEIGNVKNGLQGGEDVGKLQLSPSDDLTFRYNVHPEWISFLSISNGEQTISSPGYSNKPESFTVKSPILKIECQMGIFMGQYSVLKSLRIYNFEGFKTIGNWDDKNNIIQSTPKDVLIQSMTMRGSTGAIDAIGIYYIKQSSSTEDSVISHEPDQPPQASDALYVEIGNEIGVTQGTHQGGYDKGVLTLSPTDHITFQFDYNTVVTRLTMSNGKQSISSGGPYLPHSFTIDGPITKIECQMGPFGPIAVIKSLRIHNKDGYETIGNWDDKDTNIKSTPDYITILSLSLRSAAAIDAIGVKYLPMKPTKQYPPVDDLLFMEIGNEKVGSVGSGYYQGGYDKGTLELTPSDKVTVQASVDNIIAGLSLSNGRQTIKSFNSRYTYSYTFDSPITKIECQLGVFGQYTVIKSLRFHSAHGFQTIGKWNKDDVNIKSTPDDITIHSLSLRSDAAIDAIGVKYSHNK